MEDLNDLETRIRRLEAYKPGCDERFIRVIENQTRVENSLKEFSGSVSRLNVSISLMLGSFVLGLIGYLIQR